MIDEFLNKANHGDVLNIMGKIPDKAVNCIVTSPPYWQQRDYGWDGQWGNEETVTDYLNHLMDFMKEAYRILVDDGTVWINLGDTYYKKSLMLIPHRFAINCYKSNWLVRNDICWIKSNAMPDGVQDRLSSKHEYFFLLTKNKKHFFNLDAIRDKHKEDSIRRACRGQNLSDDAQYAMKRNQENIGYDKMKEKLLAGELIKLNKNGKNPGTVAEFWDQFKTEEFQEFAERLYVEMMGLPSDVWDIPKGKNSNKHFATYNKNLIHKPILAGCPKGGIILDSFCGTGTTLIESLELGMIPIGIDGKQEFCDISNSAIREQIKINKSRLNF